MHDALRDAKVRKAYLALLCGRWRGGPRRVDAPLAKNRLRSGERVVRVDRTGKAALTRFEPLAVGDATPAEVATVLERVWGGAETLIVISSDLSHYLPYETATRTDADTVRLIENLQPGLSHTQACGATPVNGLLSFAASHALDVEVLDLRNSGDTAGDKTRVVGYSAIAFYEAGGGAQ